MLQRLSIQNYALIDRLDLELNGGMNIITGETGAGKSILLGALGLILGQRSDTEALLDKSRKCVVEGTFAIDENSTGILHYLRENDLDPSLEIHVRRELSPEGKSRSFINDTPVNLQQLKEFTGMLVDIHSQHQTLLINKADFQLAVVDALAGTQEALVKYRTDFKAWQQLNSKVIALEEAEQKAVAEQDYLRYQYQELEEAALKAGEQPELERELSALSNAGEINSKLSMACAGLTGTENDVVSQLTQISQQLQVLSRHDEKIKSLSERLKSVAIELKDIASEAEDLTGVFRADPTRTDQIENRLDTIYRLEKKHRVNSVEELIVLGNAWSDRLNSMESLSDELDKYKKQEAQMLIALIAQAEQISATRTKAIPKIEKKIHSMLADVALPNGKLVIQLTTETAAKPGPSGIDKIKFLFSANKGVEPTDIGKVASGGELSRLMLCIKAAVAASMALPTMIFDEIDTGISGETALKIGEVMNELSRHHQLIAITHLPQIASRGAAHYFVRKQVAGKKTLTEVVILKPEERLVEIARMLSGDKPTPAALANAKDLLTR
jgi:DNA repair protein RecN (Recombination protein N)